MRFSRDRYIVPGKRLKWKSERALMAKAVPVMDAFSLDVMETDRTLAFRDTNGSSFPIRISVITLVGVILLHS